MIKIEQLLTGLFRHAQRLFHALVGLVFIFFAVTGSVLAYSEWRLYREAPDTGLVRFSLFAGFSVVLAMFGLYSFLKARSVK